MAMSRKHYQDAAEVIRRGVNDADSYEGVAIARGIATGLADMFKRDNSRFDRSKFLEAAGLGEDN